VREILFFVASVAAAALLGMAGDAPAQAKNGGKGSTKAAEGSGEATPQRRQQLQAEQKQLQQRLARMKKQLADSETSHSEAADALAESEQAISNANRRLRELAEARRQLERQIANLQDRGRGVGMRQSDQEVQLARLLSAQLRLAQPSSWQRWLGGDSPAAAARDSYYLDLAARARARSIVDLRERREELHQLEAESLLKQAELAGIAQEEKEARLQLLQQQNSRKQTLTSLSRQISSQRQTIASLERDDQRLGSLVEQLTRMLAEQARRAEQAKRAEQARRAAAPPSRPGGSAQSGDVEPPPGSKLAALRDKMHLPVKGEVIARFGTPRKTEAGVNAPTWRGVLIRAPQGAEVRSVAAGRVVFADWLRGFGNLLIVDHGEGLLSVYGNNESLLRSVGDRIEADDVISAVGNTGGNTESGLYFELRFEGRPIDPLKWARAR
jgi:septal ring factor EnvC (AmiA/AmiB activator)